MTSIDPEVSVLMTQCFQHGRSTSKPLIEERFAAAQSITRRLNPDREAIAKAIYDWEYRGVSAQLPWESMPGPGADATKERFRATADAVLTVIAQSSAEGGGE